MALIGNNADTLLNGLSAFWHRFFRDIGDLQATYEGTEMLLGQVYLNILSDVLNTSVVEAPLFRKEYYKLITIREDQLVFREQGEPAPFPDMPSFYDNPGFNRYVYRSETFYNSIPQLQDTVFAPKASLEETVDYRVLGGEIQFTEDPTDPVLPGFAKRQVTIAIGGKFTSATTLDWVSAGVEKGDTLYYSESIDLGVGSPLNAQDTARSATIIHVTPTKLTVSIDTPFPTFPVGAVPSGFSWRVMRLKDDGTYNMSLPQAPSDTPPFTDGQIEYASTLEVAELSFWAVDSLVDDLTLYKTYGYFFTEPQLSSEAYRSLIRGLMQLYILGPAMARLESALNLTAGLATIREEGEILEGYDSGILATGSDGELPGSDVFTVTTPTFDVASVGGFIQITDADTANNIGNFNIIQYISPTSVKLKPKQPFTVDIALKWQYSKTNAQVVTTDRDTYSYPLDIPMREDVIDPSNFGTLTFRAFESLTTAILVTDYVSDPEWWHTITVPQEILPDWSAAQRVVTPQFYPSVLGNVGNAYIGDPGFYIGATELSDNPLTNEPDLLVTANAYHYKAAFILFDRFLKLHMFAVIVDPAVSLTGLLVTDLQKILKDVKPVHTALYFQPVTTFNDVINISDETLDITAAKRRLEKIGPINNQWNIGSGWNIGDTWEFSGAVGGGININPGPTGMFVAIGGADPLIQPADAGDVPPATDPPYYDDPSYPIDIHWISRPLYVYMHA